MPLDARGKPDSDDFRSTKRLGSFVALSTAAHPTSSAQTASNCGPRSRFTDQSDTLGNAAVSRARALDH
jgi:hypothetical protein